MADAETGRKRGSKKTRRSPIGASPGTLVAHPTARRSELTLTCISPGGHEVFHEARIEDIVAQRQKWPVIWLDCSGLANIDLIRKIGEQFGLHALALEDTVNVGQRPKVDFFDDHAFVVVSMIDDHATHRYEQISIFFGKDFVITFQEREGDPFDPVRKRVAHSVPPRIRVRGADYLAYALIDAIVDSYFVPVEATGETIDRIEDEMLGEPQKEQIRQMHELRRGTTTLKRVIWPLRDALAGLMRADVPFLQQETKVYLNDTLDHSIRLIELVESQRDALTGLIEMHISLTQARLNEVISFLTIVSVMFIPLTFLAGIWGMNFDPTVSPWNMPELTSRYGYPIALGLMAATAVTLLAFFRWKKWL